MIPAWVLRGIERPSFVFRWIFGFAGSLGAADPPVPLGPVPPIVICEGFKGGQSEIELKSK